MKKTLLLQTAIVAAAGALLADVASAQVKAEPLAATLGGYFTQFWKVQDRDLVTPTAGGAKIGQVDEATQSMTSDAEIWFNFRTVLDNNLRIGGRVELEAASYADQIDEAYIFIEDPDIGRIEAGSTDKVSGKMLYFAPTALPGHATTVHSEYTAAKNTPLMWFQNANHDTQGISLYTASNRYLGSKAGKGIQLGLSYVPDGCEDFSSATGAAAASVSGGSGRSCGGAFGTTNGSSTGVTAGNQLSQQWNVAANYLESFGQVDVALFATYNSVHIEGNHFIGSSTALANTSTDARQNGWALGAQLAYNVGDGSTVTLGGGYVNEDVGRALTGAVNANRVAGAVDNNKSYSVGLRYLSNGANAGSFGVGVEYFNRTFKMAATSDKNKYNIVTLGVTYQLAPGVLTFAGAGVDKLDVPGPNAATGTDLKQTFGVLGISLNF